MEARSHKKKARIRRFWVRLNDAEHTGLDAAARKLGMKSKSELIRSVIERLSASSNESAQPARARPITIYIKHREDEQRYLFELNRLGNNLNQIAKWCNTYKAEADAHQVAFHLFGVKQEMDAIKTALKK